jgi:hypothetical protein
LNRYRGREREPSRDVYYYVRREAEGGVAPHLREFLRYVLSRDGQLAVQVGEPHVETGHGALAVEAEHAHLLADGIGEGRSNGSSTTSVLTRRPLPMMLRLAMAYVRDRGVAEDVVQEAWIDITRPPSINRGCGARMLASGPRATVVSHIRPLGARSATPVYRPGAPRTELAGGPAQCSANGSRIFAYGIGPSEFVARYAAFRLGRLGLKTRATGLTGFRLADELVSLRAEDAVLLYAPRRLLHDVDVLLGHASKVGARVILVTDPFQRAVDERVYALLAAVHTPTGFSGEMLTAAAITDAMVLAIATQEKARAEATFDQLAVLRHQIARTASDSMRRSRRSNRSR